MKYYFTLLAKRCFREFGEYKVHPVFIIAVGAGMFTGISWIIFSRLSYPEFLYTGLALWGCYLLGGRKRNEFLKRLFTLRTYLLVRLTENVLGVLPFVVFMVCNHLFLWSLVVCAAACALSFHNTVGRTFVTIPTPFSGRPFEFALGFRKYMLLIVLTYVCGILAYHAGNTNFGIVSLLCCFAICQYFYFTVEPPVVLWMYVHSMRRFLMEKSVIAVCHSFLLAFPLSLIVMAIDFGKTPWVLLAFVAGILYVLLGVSVKYTYFPDNPSPAIQFLVGIALFFPPFAIILIPICYMKASKTLKNYLK